VLARGLSKVDRATTLAHELAHHLLHAGSPGGPEVPTERATRETEAEGASYALFSCYGLDTGRFSFAYVARYAERPEVLAASLERIQRAARRLIAAVEGAEPQGGRS
jgi:Zn-dependent peptidase ImmA (M78 family)